MHRVVSDSKRLFVAGAGDDGEAPIAVTGIQEFNEDAYLACYPDIRAAIEAGMVTSGLDHYAKYGRAEARLAHAGYISALTMGAGEREAHGRIAFSIETVIMGENGAAFVVGWIDDRTSPLVSLSLFVGGREAWNTRAAARCRRADVEREVSAPPGHLFGFWALLDMRVEGGAQPSVMVRVRLGDGAFAQVELAAQRMSDIALRETVLEYFAHAEYAGNPDVERFGALDGGAGLALAGFNSAICAAIKRAPYAERFGPAPYRFAMSFVICLFGKPEFLFLQAALFSPGCRHANVEFIYVSNSPELAERLQKEARIAAKIYGVSITLVTLTGNAGFSAANNVAASFARSDRIVFMNPDVFPRGDDWAARFAALLAAAPEAQTRIFGVPLYYADGSLMHGGMSIETDRGMSVGRHEITTRPMLRVAHYGKGAPEWAARYTRARAVPAVSGAFISVAREWFEMIEGFSEDFILGHYEDADLCLTSLTRGCPVWLQDIRFWHFEGQGGSRRPAHQAGAAVNRWLFTRRWHGAIADGLLKDYETPGERLDQPE